MIRVDEHLREQIRDLPDIQDRLQRALMFLEYLDMSWKQGDPSGCGWNWNEVSTEARVEIERVLERQRSRSARH